MSQNETTAINAKCGFCGKEITTFLSKYYVDGIWYHPHCYRKAFGNQEENQRHTVGWECPKCGRVNAPFVETCPCYDYMDIKPFTGGNTNGDI
jgi:bacterioferritin-associated ferredoxin